MQCTLATSNTCYARLAWLERYEKKNGVVNALAQLSNRERYEEYLHCRKCCGLETKKNSEGQKGERKPMIITRKWTEPCACGKTEIAAHGMCGACYQKMRYERKKNVKPV